MRMPLIHTFIRFFYRRGMFGSQSPFQGKLIHLLVTTMIYSESFQQTKETFSTSIPITLFSRIWVINDSEKNNPKGVLITS